MKINHKQKMMAVTAALLVTSNVFAATVKGGAREKQETKAIGGATAGATRAQGISSLLNHAMSAGLIQRTDRTALEDQLLNGDLRVSSNRKEKDGSRTDENIFLTDMIQDLTARAKDLSKEQIALASKLIETISKERADQRDSSLEKLIVEANALLSTGSKAKKEEVESYTSTLQSINKMVHEGDARNVDQAAQKVLTDKQKKELEECIRG